MERDRRRYPGATGRLAILAALLFGVSGCASAPEDGGVDVIRDPLEPMNRTIFAVNDAVDTLVLRPASVTYRDWVPTPVQSGVQNVLRNLRTPLILINEVLQGDWRGADHAATRFFLNSTIGLGGVFDIAEVHGYPYQSEDFGQTLAVWGVDSGPYLVLPVLGPSTVRDGFGVLVDAVADPVGNVINDTPDAFAYTRLSLPASALRSRTLEATDELRRASVDYYATLRSVYQQARQAEINDGAPTDVIDIPDYEDFDDPVSDTFEDGLTDDGASGALPSEPEPLGRGAVSMLPVRELPTPELNLEPVVEP